MNYYLHEKANGLRALHEDMKARIEMLKISNNYYSQFPELTKKHLNTIDTCNRGLERIEQAYIKVLTEILAL